MNAAGARRAPCGSRGRLSAGAADSSAVLRDRRPLFASAALPQSQAAVDPESLERDNDRGIDRLGASVGQLKEITQGLHREAESHNRLLDRVGDTMSGAQMGIAGAATRFKRVFETPQGRRWVYVIGGTALAVVVLYYAFKAS